MASKKEESEGVEDGRTSSRTMSMMMKLSLVKGNEEGISAEMPEVLFVLCQARYQGIVDETCL